MGKRQKGKKVRRKAVCACGLRRRSQANVSRHATAWGHALKRTASKG